MKLTLIYTLLLALSVNRASSQEKIWTRQSNISEVIAFEKKINPEAKFLNQDVSLSKDYYPLADKYKVTNPVIVYRQAMGYLPIYAEYFYTPGDSVLRLVSYDWEKGRYDNFFDKQKMWQEENKKFDAYNEEYERIKKDLIDKLGKPTSDDKSAKSIKNEGSSYLNRNTLWDTDSIFTDLNMIFSAGTHRIRLTLYWKK